MSDSGNNPIRPNKEKERDFSSLSRRELIQVKGPESWDDTASRSEDAASQSLLADSRAVLPLMSFSTNAMGCEFQVLCGQQAMRSIAETVQDGFDLIHGLESRLTIFSDDSEMAFLNRMAHRQPVALEPGLFDLLKTAHKISEASAGAFDLSATSLTRLWKRHRSQRTLPDQKEIDDASKSAGYRHLSFDDTKRTVFFDVEGLQLDLGGIGKGYALDRLSEFLAMSDCCDFLVHGGQSSVICNGSRSILPDQSWQVGITHPLSPAVRLALVDLNGRAIGTSGSGRKSYVACGNRYGHIIDPRTGRPAERLLSTTVLAESAMLADALATTLFVTGPEMAEPLCELFDASAIMLSQASAAGDLQIETCRLSAADWKLV